MSMGLNLVWVIFAYMFVKAFRTGFAAPKLHLGSIWLILLTLPTNSCHPMMLANHAASLFALSEGASLLVLL